MPDRFGGSQTGEIRLQFLSGVHYGDNHWVATPSGHTTCTGPDCIICQHATPKEPIPMSKFDLMAGA